MYKLAFWLSLSVLLLCIVISVIIAVIENKKSGKKTGLSIRLPRKSFIERLLWELPYQLVCDMYNTQDYEFKENGFHLIVGEQGTGKTITVVYLLEQYRKQYPKIKIRTNMKYQHEDGEIKSWRDLVFKNNGIYGQIDVLDEVQNWFNSLQSKDFPVEMFQEITQQRKQRKMIIGTSQVWQRVAKPIREQVKLVYKPVTLFGCLTIVRVFKPLVNSEGGIDEMKYRGCFFFVHNKELRDAFDTYHKIQVMSLKGFKAQTSVSQSPYEYDGQGLPTASMRSGGGGKA